MAAITLDHANAILADNFAEWVRDLDITVVETDDDAIVLKIPFSDRLCRIGGVMCGQALISAADTAMVIALASALGGMRAMTTVDLTCSFLRPVSDEDAVVSARVVRLGRSLSFAACDIDGGDSGKCVCTATGTYAMLD